MEDLVLTSLRSSGWAPLAPDQIRSANLLEYFLFDRHHVFSDIDGAVPATKGGLVARVKAQAGRDETLTQNVEGRRPTWSTSYHESRRPALRGNDTSTYMVRSCPKPARTVLVIYELNKYQRAPPNDQCLFGAASTAASQSQIKTLYALRRSHDQIDQAVYCDLRSNGSTPTAPFAAICGATDTIVVRDNGVKVDVHRDGILTNTGIAEGPGAELGVDAQFLMAGTKGGAVCSWLSGNVLAFVTFDAWVSDVELAGLFAWSRGLSVLPEKPKRYLGAYFQANHLDENASAACFAMIQTDDLKTFAYRPSNMLGVALGTAVRDPSLISDGDDVWFVKTGGLLHGGPGGGFRIWKASRDRFNFDYLGDIETFTSGGSAKTAVWAPEFVKKQDGTMWVDADGLPAIVFAQSLAGSGSLQPYVVTPNDGTWKYGGRWNAPVALDGAWPTTFIDCSCMCIDGTFWLLGAGQGTNQSAIYLWSARDLSGRWNQVSANLLYDNALGYEAPQMIWLGERSYILHVDLQGLGYYWCQSNDGPAGPYGPLRPIDCPFYPQHGNVIPMPPGW